MSWLPPDTVVALTGLSLRELFRRIEAREVHINEFPSGLLLICPKSIDLKLRDSKVTKVQSDD